MSITTDQVQHVARLARLHVDAADTESLAEDLNGILDLVDQMASCNTDGVEPMANPFDAVQRLRDDNVTEVDQREQLQAGAPATERGLYLVPRVID